jgi:hypothetical protein
MRFEECWIYHGRMTAPAEKGDISPEQNISGPVRYRVRLYGMAEKTNRPSVDAEYIAMVVQHDVRIDLRIFFLSMALKAEYPLVDIRTSTQEIYAPSSVALNVAGPTHDFPVIKRESCEGEVFAPSRAEWLESLLVKSFPQKVSAVAVSCFQVSLISLTRASK